RDGCRECVVQRRAAARRDLRDPRRLRGRGHRQHVVAPRNAHDDRRRHRGVVVSELRAVDGRVPGRRGRATRDKLLKATADLLEKKSFRDLTVVDIAKRAKTSTATFYQYFEDVEAAIVELARQLTDEGPRLVDIVRGARWND